MSTYTTLIDTLTDATAESMITAKIAPGGYGGEGHRKFAVDSQEAANDSIYLR